MKLYHHTEPGSLHINEDAIAFTLHPENASVLICALADGQGGRAGGETASKASVSLCIEKVLSRSPLEIANPSTWVSVCHEVDREVSLLDDAGFTTLIGLGILSTFAAGASVGDSAVLLMLGEKSFILSERQQKNPPAGSSAALMTPFAAPLASPWKLLVMSDGVWKYIGRDKLVELAEAISGEELIKKIREGAVANTGQRLMDDFSIILIEG